jgi:cytoskeletal protein CcmA (bactofilin family)
MSCLGRRLTVNGQLDTDCEIEIHGRALGRINARRLHLALSGYIEGDVVANDVQISGRFFGRVFARNVVLDSTAKICGRIFHHTANIARGAHVDGRMPWRPLNFFDDLERLPEETAMTMFTRQDKVSDSSVTNEAQEARSVEVYTPSKGASSRYVSTGNGAPTDPPQSMMPSMISKALKITGQLESSEDIQIDGNIEGDVRALSVKVGCGASVKGSVYGESVELAGSVNGKIEAKKVVLTATARMCGDVIHQSIQIDAGAYLDGHCRPDFGKAEEIKMHPIHAAAAAREKENTKRAANGGAKAEFSAV